MFSSGTSSVFCNTTLLVFSFNLNLQWIDPSPIALMMLPSTSSTGLGVSNTQNCKFCLVGSHMLWCPWMNNPTLLCVRNVRACVPHKLAARNTLCNTATHCWAGLNSASSASVTHSPCGLVSEKRLLQLFWLKTCIMSCFVTQITKTLNSTVCCSSRTCKVGVLNFRKIVSYSICIIIQQFCFHSLERQLTLTYYVQWNHQSFVLLQW